MFTNRPCFECRKKPKPAAPGAPPGKKPNRSPAKERLQHNQAPVNHGNKIRQHYTRVQRG
jgi:hypothetical protein